jgi:AcrR family transcriptional regulator
MTTEITNRQKEIIEVSLKLISETGIQGFTIKNLAKKIGFTEAAVYRHFENKTQILVAILDYFKQNSERFYSSELQTESDSIIKIEQLFLNHFNIFTETPSMVSVIFSEEIFRNEISLHQKMSEIIKTTSLLIINIIENGQKNAQIRNDINAKDLATIIMGSLRLYIKQWQMSNYAFDLKKQGVEFINSIKLLIKKY